jgi:multiple sugar transport system ATP-binding protein
MGRAIVRSPAVFLFDEPLSNLDAKLRVQMRTEIKELHGRLKTTTVYVTHDQIEAMTMADKIVILRDGVIEQQGTPLEVYDHPANLFVAAFIGSPSMNLLKGDVAKGGVKLADGTVLPLPAGHKGKVGQKVVYGIRPEHLKPAKAGIPAKVVVVEPTGPEIHIYADLGGQEVCAITDERLQLARDVAIKLMPKLDKVHLFDAESGEALA